MVAEHPAIDAVVYLGLGIQSNQARLMRDGPVYPGDGLERIVDYHERQDARFAQAAAEISDATGKPILTATELAVAIPDNPGPRRGPRERTALLRVVATRGHRARTPVPLRAVPRPARPRVTPGAIRDAPRRPSSAASSAASLVVARGRARRARPAAARRRAGGPARPRRSARRCGRCGASRSR